MASTSGTLSAETSANAVLPQIQPRVAVNVFAPSSAHAGGINVAMGDGGVKFINGTISQAAWGALLTPNGQDNVNIEGF